MAVPLGKWSQGSMHPLVERQVCNLIIAINVCVNYISQRFVVAIKYRIPGAGGESQASNR